MKLNGCCPKTAEREDDGLCCHLPATTNPPTNSTTCH